MFCLVYVCDKASQGDRGRPREPLSLHPEVAGSQGLFNPSKELYR